MRQELSPLQSRAARAVASWFASASLRARRGELAGAADQFFDLDGVAGSGKTSICTALIEGIDGRVELCAYTNKAARVLSERTGSPARTLHSAIYLFDGHAPTVAQIDARLVAARAADVPDRNLIRLLDDELREAAQRGDRPRPRFALSVDAPARGAALIVVDESSMLDRRVAADLAEIGAPVLCLGDRMQLPPVGTAGYFGPDREPDFHLGEVHRQALDSPILRLANLVRTGGAPAVGDDGDDLIVIRRTRGNAPADPRLERLVIEADQLIVGRNATRHACNNKVRRLRGMPLRVPVRGDRVVSLANDRQAGLINGAQYQVDRVVATPGGQFYNGVISPLDSGGGPISVCAWAHPFEGHDVPGKRRDVAELAFAYAVTAHKAQGSQYESVVVFDESAAFGADARRWLYTAITRASRRLAIVVD